MMPNYGFGKAIACFMRTLRQLTFPIVTIAMILGLAYLMNYSGMSSTLGLAFTHTGSLFPFFSPLLGWLGVFLTGSDTSSCALFGGMQKDTATAVGMSPELAVAANASGGVTAKMISPQSLSVATAATNMVGQEGNLFRFTIGHSIAMTLDHPFGPSVPGTLCRTGAGIPSAEPLGRGFGDGLFGARAVELVRHDAGHGAGRLDVRLHALLYLQYRQSADVAVRGGSRLENQKGRIFCRPQTMIMETTVNTDLVIFDLDGTLLDTIGDLAVACNAVLALRGLPQHSYEEYCHFVGNGIMRLVERALPEELRTPYTVAAVRADFVKYYTEHIDAYTKPYDRIPELVAGLVRRGVRIAVASNKFQAGTEKLVRLFFPDVPFAAVFGQREGVPLKPDPAVVEEILSLTGAAKERVLYVGDSGVDMQTAAAAGVRSVGVTWGFRDREELVESGAAHIVDKPAEILDLL